MAAETVFRAVLFTDLVDSTRLAISHGAAFDQVRRQHFASLRDAVERYGGRGVKTIGDAIMATFPNVGAVLDAGAAMQRAVDNDNARSPMKLAMRVGVAAGDVVEEDGDCHGDAVVTASRLCSHAAAGQILCADVVRVLAGSRTEHSFVDVQPVDLKGLGRVAVVEQRWTPADRPVDLPRSLIRTARPIVGRREELEAVAAALDDPPHAALVSGEPGIGKTRLVAEIATRRFDDGSIVLYGRCDEQLTAPYAPWVEALTPLARWLGAAEVDRLAGAGGRLVTRLLDLGGDAEAHQDDPELMRLRLYDAVGALLDGVGSRTRLLVVLDDLHWSDAPSLLLMRHVLRGDRSRTVTIAGTYRETDLDRGHLLTDVLGDLRRDRSAVRIPLRGLDVESTADLIATWAGHDPEERFVAAVHAETDGNPFFVEEVIQHLAETGAVYQRDGRWMSDAVSPDDLGIPQGVREVVGRRLARLPSQADEVLATAAVVGRQFDVRLLRNVDDHGDDAIDAAIDAAVAARLLEPVDGAPGHLLFSHALVQATLYDELGTMRRVRLHARVGAELDRLGADPASVAHHLLEAAAGGDVLSAARAALAAAHSATARYSYEDAITFASRGLEVLTVGGGDEPELAVHLNIALTSAHAALAQSSARLEAGRRAIEIARRFGDPDLFFRAVLAFMGPRDIRQPPDETVALIEEALAWLPADRVAERVDLLRTLAVAHTFTDPSGRGADIAAEAVTLAEQLDDPRARAAVGFALAVSMTGCGRAHERVRLLEQAASSGGQMTPVTTAMHLVVATFEAGDRAAFEQHLGRLEAEVVERSVASMLVQPWLMRSVLALAEGRFDDAIALTEQGYAAAAGDDQTAGLARWALTTCADLERGRFAQHLAAHEAIAQIPTLPGVRPAIAWALYDAGRVDEAKALYEELAEDGFGFVPRNWGRGHALMFLVDLAWAFQDRERAGALLDMLDPFAGTIVVWYAGAGTSGAADRHRARLLLLQDRVDEALDLLEQARALEMGIGGRALVARTDLWRARALERGGAPSEEVAGICHGVRDEAEAMGMGALLAEVDFDLQRR